jgi:hypothetical protein
MVLDDELNAFKRTLLGRGLKKDLDERLRFLRSLTRKGSR